MATIGAQRNASEIFSGWKEDHAQKPMYLPQLAQIHVAGEYWGTITASVCACHIHEVSDNLRRQPVMEVSFANTQNNTKQH